MRTKQRLPITLKLFKDGKVLSSAVLQKKSQVMARAEAVLWDKAYCKVVYGKDKGQTVYNDWECHSVEQLKKMLADFTEKSLVDFLSKSKGGK